MTHTAKCKMCGKQLTLHSDDSYIGDPLKLLPLITCNRCYDFRDRCERISFKVYGAAIELIRGRNEGGKEQKLAEDKARKQFEILTRSYAEAIGKHYHHPILWEPEFVDMLMEKPDKWHTILRNYRGMIQQALPQVEVNQPHND